MILNPVATVEKNGSRGILYLDPAGNKYFYPEREDDEERIIKSTEEKIKRAQGLQF